MIFCHLVNNNNIISGLISHADVSKPEFSIIIVIRT